MSILPMYPVYQSFRVRAEVEANLQYDMHDSKHTKIVAESLTAATR